MYNIIHCPSCGEDRLKTIQKDLYFCKVCRSDIRVVYFPVINVRHKGEKIWRTSGI